MQPHELTPAQQRSAASAFWNGAHHDGEPLGWHDMNDAEQRDAAARFKIQGDDTRTLLETVPKMLVAIETCQRGLAALIARPAIPKGLAKAVAKAISEHARSRGESESADARLESLLRSQIRSVEGLTGLVEALDERVRKLESKV